MLEYYKRMSEDLWQQYNEGSHYLVAIALAMRFFIFQWESHPHFEPTEFHYRVLVDLLWILDPLRAAKARSDTSFKTLEKYMEQNPMIQKGECHF